MAARHLTLQSNTFRFALPVRRGHSSGVEVIKPVGARRNYREIPVHGMTQQTPQRGDIQRRRARHQRLRDEAVDHGMHGERGVLCRCIDGPRFDAQWGRVFGTLPEHDAQARLLERAWPV